jgi:endonuclease/exonuclease/phosphatase (EEP) superfamily protein YafD
MRRFARFITALTAGYAVGIVAWQVLRLVAGDRWWWLALANAFSPYLFLPLVALLPLAVLARRRVAFVATVVPLVVFLVLYGGLFLPQISRAGADDATTLRVMTLNLLVLNDDGAAVQRQIQAESPDVICLQELTPRMAADLEQRLGDEYPHFSLMPEGDTSGAGVFSRYPLRDEGELPDPAAEAGWWRHGAQAVTVDYLGRSVLVLNIHALPHYLEIDDPRWAERFEQGFQMREKQIKAWMDWVQQYDGPVVAAGDLNFTDQNRAYRLMAGQLNDAHRQAGYGLGHTWHAYSRGFVGLPLPSRLLRLDYVWYSDHWKALEVRVGDWDGQSDHLSVVAELLLASD